MARQGSADPRPATAIFCMRPRNGAGAADDLGGVPRSAHASPSMRTRHVAREIDRDERVVLLALRRRLRALLRPALVPEAPRELNVVLDAVGRAVTEARAQARRLNDARIVRRGERPQRTTAPKLPAALASHACHGEYLGAFPDLAAVGHMAFKTCPEVQVGNALPDGGPTDIALDLHLRGILWTLDHAGEVHVFRCR